MDQTLSQLEQAYLDYREALKTAATKHKPTDGIFGIGHSIKDDACHEQFDAQVLAAVQALAADGIQSDDAEKAIRMIFTQMSEYRYPPSAEFMLYATERHIPLLIPLLSTEAAERLHSEYTKRYRRWARLPAQNEVCKALQQAAQKK